MAHIYLDGRYAPCGFLIVRDGDDPYGGETVLVQSDWDFPGVASHMGFVPCADCDQTDGTVNCAHRTASDMISAAYKYAREHAGESFSTLDEYLEGED